MESFHKKFIIIELIFKIVEILVVDQKMRNFEIQIKHY